MFLLTYCVVADPVSIPLESDPKIVEFVFKERKLHQIIGFRDQELKTQEFRFASTRLSYAIQLPA